MLYCCISNKKILPLHLCYDIEKNEYEIKNNSLSPFAPC